MSAGQLVESIIQHPLKFDDAMKKPNRKEALNPIIVPLHLAGMASAKAENSSPRISKRHKSPVVEGHPDDSDAAPT